MNLNSKKQRISYFGVVLDVTSPYAVYLVMIVVCE